MSVHTEHRTIDTTAIHPESSTIMESADEEDEVESSLPTTAKTAPTGTLVEVEVPVFVPPKQEDQKTEMFRPRVEASRSSGRTEWMEQVIKFCRSKNLKLVDNREKNGALWAYYPIQDGAIASRFKEWGFKFVEGKGWWTK